MSYDRVIGDDGVSRYYQQAGSGPALVFLHGFSGNHLSWYQQVPAFADDYRCIVPDQRMFGRSADSSSGPGAAAFPDDLVDLLDRLDVDRAAIVGHSMSGWTATSVATRWPDRVAALVLSGTPGGLISPDCHEIAREAAEGSIPDVDPLNPASSYLSESIAELNRDAPEEFVEIRPTLDELDIDADAIVSAGVPSYLIAGEADPFMPSRALEAVSETLSGAPISVVNGAAHSANFERPEAFNRELRSFLEAADY